VRTGLGIGIAHLSKKRRKPTKRLRERLRGKKERTFAVDKKVEKKGW